MLLFFTMSLAGLSQIEYALCALNIKHAKREATLDDVKALNEHATELSKITYDTYHELLKQFNINKTSELYEQLENLYSENYSARNTIFVLYHLEQEIEYPDRLAKVWAELPSKNEVFPSHRTT